MGELIKPITAVDLHPSLLDKDRLTGGKTDKATRRRPTTFTQFQDHDQDGLIGLDIRGIDVTLTKRKIYRIQLSVSKLDKPGTPSKRLKNR